MTYKEHGTHKNRKNNPNIKVVVFKFSQFEIKLNDAMKNLWSLQCISVHVFETKINLKSAKEQSIKIILIRLVETIEFIFNKDTISDKVSSQKSFVWKILNIYA